MQREYQNIKLQEHHLELSVKNSAFNQIAEDYHFGKLSQVLVLIYVQSNHINILLK